MFDTKRLKADFGAAAGGYDAHARLQDVIREICERKAKESFPVNARVLDLGAGTGSFARKHGKQWDIINLDAAWGMCAFGRQAADGLFVNAVAEQLPFADSSFDGVFSSLMLQWSNTPLRVFEEIARVLKPGGTAIIATFTKGTLCELEAAFHALDDATHVSDFLTRKTLEDDARVAGLLLRSSESDTIIQQHDSLLGLMRSLKDIGAAHKESGRRRSLMTPRQLQRIESSYRSRFAQTGALPASWQVLYMQLEKSR